jgi:hypothetical protein
VAVPIKPIQVVPALLAACPSFEPVWAAIEHDNVDEDVPAGRLLYLDAAQFVRHIGQLQLADSTGEFDGVFDVIERFIVEGDDYVSSLGVIGILEVLQMATITSLGLDPEMAFRPWFRPVSGAWWERLNRFWAGEHDALQVTNEQVVAEARREPDSDPP